MDEQRERELKFDVASTWELGEPVGVLPPGSTLEREEVRLQSTYYDTAELDLLRAGLTLRRRTGDIDTGWQLKVPEGNARTELRLPPDGPDIPTALLDLTIGVRAAADLDPIATVTTRRSVARILGPDSTGLAEIVVDAVTATHGTKTQRWREVEVELLDGDEQLLSKIAAWLQQSGAAPAQIGSKLARAVGGQPRSTAAPGSLDALVGAYLDAQYEAMLRGDLDLRRGRDVIHGTRVATRRYRSVLRVFAKVLDASRAEALDAELKWYAAALGAVRDRQVLRRHLDRALAELPPELVMGPVATRIHDTIDREQREASAALDRVMRSDRYFALFRELRAWREQLPAHTHLPAADVAEFLEKSERTVARRARKVPAGEGRAVALHRVRRRPSVPGTRLN